MDRINTSNMSTGAGGNLFKDCTPGADDGTPLDARFMNGVMMELINVITKGGQLPLIPFSATNANSYDQLWKAIQAAASSAVSSTIPAGTTMLFMQAAAPTGWTKVTTSNDVALRLVSGTGGGSGGSLSFSTAFSASRTATGSVSGSNQNTVAGGTVQGHALSINEIPNHSHTIPTNGSAGSNFANVSAGDPTTADYTLSTSSIGGGQAHAHGFVGASHTHVWSGTVTINPMAFNVAYRDVIAATKN